jgi:hypothetical protein
MLRVLLLLLLLLLLPLETVAPCACLCAGPWREQDPALTARLGIDTGRFSLSDTSQADVGSSPAWSPKRCCRTRDP